jgi:hypothetical protein
MKLAHAVTLVGAFLANTAHAEEAQSNGTPPLVSITVMAVGGGALSASWIASIGVVLGTTTCTGSLITFYGGEPLRCHSFSGWAALPVVGPTVALADNAGKQTMNGEIPFYIAMTAINVASLTAIIVGAATYQKPKRLQFAPMADAHGASMGLSGTF